MAPYATEAQRWGLTKEGTRLTAEATATEWIAVEPGSDMVHKLNLLEDKGLRGVKEEYPSFAGIKTTDGKMKLPVRARNMGELLYMAFGAPSASTEQSAFVITLNTNDKIDFLEGAGAEKSATLTAGSYTSTTLAAEVKTQLEAANLTAVTYTVTYSTTTKKFTIVPSASTITIKWATGTNTLTNAHTVLGFSNADVSATASATSDSTSQFAYKHTFLIPTGVQPPTFSIFVDRSMNVKVYNGCVAKKLSFTGAVDDYVRVEADIIGLTEASGSIGSPSYTETDPMESYDTTIKIGGSAITYAADWKLDIDTMAKVKRTLNQSQLPLDVIQANKWKIGGGFSAYFESVTERDYFLANTARSMEIIMQGALLQGTTYNKVDIILDQIHYKGYPYGDKEGLLAAQVEFDAKRSVSGSRVMAVELTNSKTSY